MASLRIGGLRESSSCPSVSTSSEARRSSGESAAISGFRRRSDRSSSEMEQKRTYGPYFDPDFDLLIESLHSPRVCIDNDTSEDCTLVKVDSANRHGILLEMVQILTDLDLVISKSYIASDGGWLMDVFHVTDQLGDKLTDPTLIEHIQKWLVRRRNCSSEVRTCLGKLVGPGHLAAEHTALELTAADRPGLLSEISAVLADLGCHVLYMQAWTHNARAAVILYLTDPAAPNSPITDPDRLADIESHVNAVVEAHQGPGETKRVTITPPVPGRVHTERRLHQLMHEDRDYEADPPPLPVDSNKFSMAVVAGKRSAPPSTDTETRVSIDGWKDKGYSVVNVWSRDRPKLLFDTVCTLTDMQYVVYHAAVSSHGDLAIQEYYIRRIDGHTLDTDDARQKVCRCLVAAVQRRVSHGLRLDVYTRNRQGLLADVTRVFRENGLSLTRAECATRGEKAVGTFYVADMSGGEVDMKMLEAVRAEIGGNVTLEVNSSKPGWPPSKRAHKSSPPRQAAGSSRRRAAEEEKRPLYSLRSLLWSHIERFSSNFGITRS